ncbi:MAG: DUF721 domain-containing protein [Phycisphaerae bacterium]|nr:DUF721 domain-containing protein [Phycisphaerae bacterium]
MQEWQLRNVWQNRQPKNRVSALAEPLTTLMKRHLAKRVRQIGQLSIAWDECVPDFIREHAALVSLKSGNLTVAVDSASHRYRLEMLLRAGLLDAIRERFSGALNRVRLIPGEFDALEMPDRHPPQA